MTTVALGQQGCLDLGTALKQPIVLRSSRPVAPEPAPVLDTADNVIDRIEVVRTELTASRARAKRTRLARA